MRTAWGPTDRWRLVSGLTCRMLESWTPRPMRSRRHRWRRLVSWSRERSHRVLASWRLMTTPACVSRIRRLYGCRRKG